VRHLHQQRGVQQLGPFQVRGVAEHVDPLAGGYRQQYALAAQGTDQPSQQVRAHVGPRVRYVDHPVGGPVGLGPGRGQQRPVDPVPGHQLGCLRGQRFGFGRGDAVVLGLGQ
jgi:hypothetical protein